MSELKIEQNFGLWAEGYSVDRQHLVIPGKSSSGKSSEIVLPFSFLTDKPTKSHNIDTIYPYAHDSNDEKQTYVITPEDLNWVARKRKVNRILDSGVTDISGNLEIRELQKEVLSKYRSEQNPENKNYFKDLLSYLEKTAKENELVQVRLFLDFDFRKVPKDIRRLIDRQLRFQVITMSPNKIWESRVAYIYDNSKKDIPCIVQFYDTNQGPLIVEEDEERKDLYRKYCKRPYSYHEFLDDGLRLGMKTDELKKSFGRFIIV